MVYFDQHIVFPAETRSLISTLTAETRFLINTLTLVLFIFAFALIFVGAMIYQLTMAMRTQNEILGMRNRIQARIIEGKGKQSTQ